MVQRYGISLASSLARVIGVPNCLQTVTFRIVVALLDSDEPVGLPS